MIIYSPLLKERGIKDAVTEKESACLCGHGSTLDR